MMSIELQFVSSKIGADFCFADLHFSSSAFPMEDPVPKFEEWESKDALLASIDAELFSKWDGVSVPTPDLFFGGQPLRKESLLVETANVFMRRKPMVAIEGCGPSRDVECIKLILRPDRVAIEERFKPGYIYPVEDKLIRMEPFRVTFIMTPGMSRHRLGLYMRLSAEMEEFEAHLECANAPPAVWLNRYLFRARIAMILGYSFADAMFEVHVFATDCKAICAALCPHIPKEMIESQTRKNSSDLHH